MNADILKSVTAPIKLVDAPPEIIRAVQRCIGVKDDGKCGPLTLEAFNKFKRTQSLGQPDVLGPTTAKKLLEVTEAKITPLSVLAIAISELGYKESPAGSNRTKFGEWYGMNGQPWCGIFVSYCFHKAGMPLQIGTTKGFAYCPYGVEWFKKQGRFYQTPQVGDVVFFDFGGNDGIPDHTGIVEKVNPDGTITTIEGNTGTASQCNGGEVMRRVRKPNVILGYGRFNWI